MLFLIFIPVVASLFNFDYISIDFTNVQDGSSLFTFAGKNMSIFLQTKGNIELVLLQNDSFEIFSSPMEKDVVFEYNTHGYYINGREMNLLLNQSRITEFQALKVCHDFTTDKTIFEVAIGILAFVILGLLGRLNQNVIILIHKMLNVYISNETLDNNIETLV